MPLTDTACKNAKCASGRTYQRFTDSGGLYLGATATGSKLWRWKYRFNGKEKRLAVGIYPEVSLAQARRARDDARLLLKSGADPAQSKADAKLSARVSVGNTFEAVARAWHEHWKAGKSERHADYVLTRLEADVFPDLGKRPIASITAPQLLAVAKKIEARGAVDIAKRAWQLKRAATSDAPDVR